MKLFYSPTIGAIAAALAKAQSEMGKAHKSSTNPHFKSKYADLSECIDAAVPALNKHNIALTQLPGGEGDCIQLTTLLTHESGEYIGCTASMTARKPGPHEYGGILTYLRRYSLAAITGLAQEDDDGNAASKAVAEPVGTVTEKQAGQILDMVAATEADLTKFLNYLGAGSVETIAAKDFGKAMNALKAKAKAAA